MNNTHKEWSRRKFITSLSASGAAVIANPLWSWAINNENPRVAKIVAKTIGIDTHNHIDVPFEKVESAARMLDLSGELQKSGLAVIVMTFATDYKRNIQPSEAYERFQNGLMGMDKVLSDNSIKRALNLANIRYQIDRTSPKNQ